MDAKTANADPDERKTKNVLYADDTLKIIRDQANVHEESKFERDNAHHSCNSWPRKCKSTNKCVMLMMHSKLQEIKQIE